MLCAIDEQTSSSSNFEEDTLESVVSISSKFTHHLNQLARKMLRIAAEVDGKREIAREYYSFNSAADSSDNITDGQDELREQLSIVRADLHRELRVVGEIQRSLLPAMLPVIPGFDLASYYQPSALAGGDYYDVVPLAQDQWGLVVADVAGHGASAAVIMAVMRSLVHAHLPHTRFLPSSEFLEFINKQMAGVYTRDGRFVTVWCAVLDPVARTLTYASAGHNPPRLLRRGNVIALDTVGGLPLGIEEDAAYQQTSVALEPGDLLVVYTDGITEAARSSDGEREFFDTDRLDALIAAGQCDCARDCVACVQTAVAEFAGIDVPADDQTLLVLRVVN